MVALYAFEVIRGITPMENIFFKFCAYKTPNH
jgi:hypothetical protein